MLGLGRRNPQLQASPAHGLLIHAEAGGELRIRRAPRSPRRWRYRGGRLTWAVQKGSGFPGAERWRGKSAGVSWLRRFSPTAVMAIPGAAAIRASKSVPRSESAWSVRSNGAGNSGMSWRRRSAATVEGASFVLRAMATSGSLPSRATSAAFRRRFEGWSCRRVRAPLRPGARAESWQPGHGRGR